MEDLIGKQLGQYQIAGALGAGGMASVYKAYQPAMDRHVALKILPRQFATDPKSGPEFIGRFDQEAKVIAQLQHPHILPVFDFGEADGYTYLVMPFVESGTLADLMQGRPLALPQIRRIVSQIGEALDYAHSRGVVHRDIKPSNVLVDARGNCQLTDFGIAKIVAATSKFTQTGGVIGTPAYMSPEQGRGESEIDGRSDIYSLGVLLYEIAVGRVPYDAETPIAVLFKHIDDPLPLPRASNPDVPEAVERVILRALAKHADERYANAADMVQALQLAIPERGSEAGKTVIEPPPAALEPTAERSPPPASAAPPEAAAVRARRPPARRSYLWWLIPAAGLAIVLAVGAVAALVVLAIGRTNVAEPATPTVAVVLVTEPVAAAVSISTTAPPTQVPSSTPNIPTATPAPSVLFALPDIYHIGDENLADWHPLYGECLDVTFQAALPVTALTLSLETFGAEARNTIYINGHEDAILPPQGVAAPNEWTTPRTVELPIEGLAAGDNILAICAAEVEIQPDFVGDRDDFQVRNLQLIAN